jgi:hypothetical protein
VVKFNLKTCDKDSEPSSSIGIGLFDKSSNDNASGIVPELNFDIRLLDKYIHQQDGKSTHIVSKHS